MDAALSLQPVAKSEARTSILAKARRISSIKTAAALTTMTVSSVLLVRAGYDWGYKLVALLFQQTSALNQGIIANFSIAHVVFPVCVGILFAGRVRATHAFKLKWILLLSIAGAAVWDSLVDDDLFLRAAEVLLAAVCGLVAYALTRWNRSRNRISNLNLPELWNVPILGTLFISSAICAVSSSDRLLPVEICSYAGCILLISYLCRSRERSLWADLESALLVLSPIFVCNALNLVGNILSLGLDGFGAGADLGWRALLSALTINLVAFAALVLGTKLPKKI